MWQLDKDFYLLQLHGFCNDIFDLLCKRAFVG